MSDLPRIVALAGACWLAAAPVARTDTLVLALDGIPYHLVVEAQSNGAFADWPAARPLVTAFPSMTNVGFVAILSPLGSERMQGYELRHSDPATNGLSGGGPFGYAKQAGAWRNLLLGGSNSLWRQTGH